MSYRGSLPYAHFRTLKKPHYLKFVLLGQKPKAKNRGSGNRVSDFRVSGGPPVDAFLVLESRNSVEKRLCKLEAKG